MTSLSGIKLTPNKDVMGTSANQRRLRATKKTKLGGEVYIGMVKTETARLSKANEKSSGGRMQIMLQIAPVDGEGKPLFPTVPLFLAVPQPTPVEVFEALNESAIDDDGIARGQDVNEWDEKSFYDYLHATARPEAQPLPKWNKEAKRWEDQLTDATYATQEDSKPRVIELMEPIHQFALDTFCNLADKDNKGEVFKGDTFAFTLAYGKDGKGFPNVRVISGADNVPAEYTVIDDVKAATESVG